MENIKKSEKYFKVASVLLLLSFIAIFIPNILKSITIVRKYGVKIFVLAHILGYLSLIFFVGIRYSLLREIKKGSRNLWFVLGLLTLLFEGWTLVSLSRYVIKYGLSDIKSIHIFFLVSVTLAIFMVIFSKMSLTALKQEEGGVEQIKEAQSPQNSFKSARLFLGFSFLIGFFEMTKAMFRVGGYYRIEGEPSSAGVIFFVYVVFILICWLYFWMLKKIEKGSSTTWTVLLVLTALGVIFQIVDLFVNEKAVFRIWNLFQMCLSILVLVFSKKGLDGSSGEGNSRTQQLREQRIQQQESQREKLKQELRNELKEELKLKEGLKAELKKELKEELKKEMEDESNN